MFFKRFFGVLEPNQNESLTKVSDSTWVSSTGETINKISDDVSISSNGTTYIRNGATVVGSDGSLFTSLGDSMSSDGSVRMGNYATGRGAMFEDDDSKW